MVPETLLTILQQWSQMVYGLVLLVPATGVGWALGEHHGFPLVAVTRVWLRRIILPKLRHRSWLVRAVVIFLNNAMVLSLILLAGVAWLLSILAIVVIGVSLGVGMRLLASESFHVPESRLASAVTLKVRFGMLLNMLEPPAILAVTGLSLARSVEPLAAGEVWRSFAYWLVPLLILAAAGESLWLGELIVPFAQESAHAGGGSPESGVDRSAGDPQDGPDDDPDDGADFGSDDDDSSPGA